MESIIEEIVMSQLSYCFAKNRAEELPDDLWDNYVLPLNYLANNILKFSKSTVVIGGRGTGKTMFLKYHCYPTLLSPKRKNIKKDDLKNIGFHWRPDTGFARMIAEEYLGKNWKVAFETYIGLSIFMEFSKFIRYLINSNYSDKKIKDELSHLVIPSDIKDMMKANRDIKLIEFDEICELYRSKLGDWISFPEGNPPIHFEAKNKWIYFINNVLKKIDILKETFFHIFIDEFENLTENQQIIINTWIKHSENPLIFHIAYKKHAIVTTATLGTEHIVDVNDYRIIDLEKIYEKNFEILASEIIMSKINHFLNLKNDFDLSSQDYIEDRKDKTYQNSMKDRVKYIFPALSIRDALDRLFDDEALINKIKEQLTSALKLKKSKIEPSCFYDIAHKEETIINSILLYRKKIVPDELLLAFNSKDKNYYQQHINNYLLGAILYFYLIYQNKNCPYFAGFERFIILSESNIRYLLELCYQSIAEFEGSDSSESINSGNFTIDIASQAIATKYSSKIQLERVPGLGSFGKDLQKIAVRLGKIFILSQKRKTQSIAELNHFSLKDCQVSDIDDDKISTLLNECKVWGILKEEKNNKRTGSQDSSTNFYILHPIFAAHFGISPRKKRKIEFTLDEFKIIMIGSEKDYQKLHDEYEKKWRIKESDIMAYNTNTLLDYME